MLVLSYSVVHKVCVCVCVFCVLGWPCIATLIQAAHWLTRNQSHPCQRNVCIARVPHQYLEYELDAEERMREIQLLDMHLNRLLRETVRLVWMSYLSCRSTGGSCGVGS